MNAKQQRNLGKKWNDGPQENKKESPQKPGGWKVAGVSAGEQEGVKEFDIVVEKPQKKDKNGGKKKDKSSKDKAGFTQSSKKSDKSSKKSEVAEQELDIKSIKKRRKKNKKESSDDSDDSIKSDNDRKITGRDGFRQHNYSQDTDEEGRPSKKKSSKSS